MHCHSLNADIMKFTLFLQNLLSVLGCVQQQHPYLKPGPHAYALLRTLADYFGPVGFTI